MAALVSKLTALAGGSGFAAGFSESLLMILVSEIGDKTFFIATIMAMRNPRAVVLAGALSALWVMTALSAALGTIAPALISDTLTHHAATALFFFFGMRSLYDSLLAWEGGSGEREEVEAELAGKGGKGKGKAAKGAKAKGKAVRAPLLSPVLLEVFSLTFLAEWGDKSQIATIGLAASSNPLGVTLGGCLGHLVISSCAVFIGNAMASRISERAVTVAGGALFLVFGMRSLLSGPDVHIHIPGSMVEAGAWKLTVAW